jgi:HD-GYP domain-containing protein (c-di-GMP phosphodiesterase class II)
LAQDVESYRRAGRINEITAVVQERAGKAYDPAIVEVFCRYADELLMGSDGEMSWEVALAAEPGTRPYLSNDEMDNVAQVLADFTDLLSSYDICHSREIATLAMEAAQHFGLPDTDLKAIQRMGWLHDLGKIAISPGIWCKPGSLTDSEWERVRLHPYYTERILSRPAILAQLGSIAALHHERQDGSGYYHGFYGNNIPPAARLLAAANFYQARIETRVYREALTPEAAADQLRLEVRAGRLDSDAVKAVLSAAGHHTPPIRRDRIAGLTEREIEVLRLMARSLSKRQMAQHLSVSEKTIDSHAMHIYEKIHVSTRAAAALFAVQHDLLGDMN